MVRLGYDGTGFAGWARQPGLRTVEGTLREALADLHVAEGGEAGGLEVASRTDRGVSARGNAIAVRSPLTGPQLLRALNGVSPELFATAAAPVSDEFRVRHAVRRRYRYFEARRGVHVARRRKAALRFAGPVDARSFGRGIPPDFPDPIPVESVSVAERPGGIVTEVCAPSFVWGMVRKIVGALREYDAGRLTLARLDDAIRGRTILTLPLAEPEPLVLWEVEFATSWVYRWAGPNRHQAARWRSVEDQLWVRREVLRSLSRERPGRGRGVPST